MNIYNYDKKSDRVQKEDVDPPVTWTITKVEEVDMARNDEPPDLVPLVHFKETEKTLPLSSKVNRHSIAQIMHTPETDDWIGRKITLYLDRTVEFQGRVTGGIRIRAPRPEPTLKRKSTSVMRSSLDDDDEKRAARVLAS
jgi:hypothetical protein